MIIKTNNKYVCKTFFKAINYIFFNDLPLFSAYVTLKYWHIVKNAGSSRPFGVLPVLVSFRRRT